MEIKEKNGQKKYWRNTASNINAVRWWPVAISGISCFSYC